MDVHIIFLSASQYFVYCNYPAPDFVFSIELALYTKKLRKILKTTSTRISNKRDKQSFLQL
jgi:hypothetical protein